MSSDELLNQFVANFGEADEDVEVDEEISEETEEELVSVNDLDDPDETPTTERQPALFQHITKVWNQMYSESQIVTEGRAWRGRMTELFSRAGVSAGQYSLALTRMRSMGCIGQVKRGGGGNASIWMMYKEPTLADFGAAKNGGYITAERQKIGDLLIGMSAINERLNQLESRVNMLVEWRIQQDVLANQEKVGSLKDIVPHTKDI